MVKSYWLLIVKVKEVTDWQQKNYSNGVKSTCLKMYLEISGFKGRWTFSSVGALGSFWACKRARAILNSRWLKMLSLTLLKMQLLQQAGRHAFKRPGHKQKHKLGTESMAAKSTAPKLLHKTDSMGLMDLKCSLITSKIWGFDGLVDQSLTGGICLVQSLNCQSNACKKNVFGWLSVCCQMSSSFIFSVLVCQ